MSLGTVVAALGCIFFFRLEAATAAEPWGHRVPGDPAGKPSATLRWILGGLNSSGQLGAQELAQRAQLEELTALGLSSEAIAFGRPLVAPGGPLAKDGRARALLARALFDGGDEARASELLDPTGLAAAEQVPVQLERARLLLDQDRLEEAKQLLQRTGGGVPAVYPDEPDCWFLLARCHARQGRLEAAALLAKQFLKLAPLDGSAPSAWHIIAQEALARGDAAAASAALERHAFLEEWHGLYRARRVQIYRSPKAGLPHFGLGLLWMRVERYAAAEAEFTTALGLEPDLDGGWFQLGEARRLAGNAQAALDTYAQGLQHQPDHLETRANRGLLLLSLGRAADGAAELERVVEDPRAAAPAFAPAFLGLARHLVSRDPQRSQALYLRYRELGGQEPLEPAR